MNNRVPGDDLLVIGYGNTLRSDDGAGPRVAAAVAELKLRGVRAIAVHQLTPEIAQAVSTARRVVFVDASVDAKAIQLRELQPADEQQILAHAADPGTLLAMARDLFGCCAKAWWLTIPMETMDFGETLSATTTEGVRAAVDAIRDLAAGHSD